MVVKKIIKYLKENPKKEVSIGHALVCDTFEFGLEQTLKKYLSLAHS